MYIKSIYHDQVLLLQLYDQCAVGHQWQWHQVKYKHGEQNCGKWLSKTLGTPWVNLRHSTWRSWCYFSRTYLALLGRTCMAPRPPRPRVNHVCGKSRFGVIMMTSAIRMVLQLTKQSPPAQVKNRLLSLQLYIKNSFVLAVVRLCHN